MSNQTETTETKKPSLLFKASKLSSVADNMWAKSKEQWKPAIKPVAFSIVPKGLKSGENEEKNQSLSNAPGRHVFGSALTKEVEAESEKVKNSEGSDEAGLSSTSSIFKKFAADEPNKEEDSKPECSSSAEAGASLKESVAAFVKQKKDGEDGQMGEEATVMTGEEGEMNIHQVTGKLYFFDVEQKTWAERGMCNLRINQKLGNTTHRLVCRAIGNQRVIINSTFFPDMIIEKISLRRVKFSACTPDNDLPQLFLFQASEASMEKLTELFFELLNLAKASQQESRKRKLESKDCDDEVAKRPAVEDPDTNEASIEERESGESATEGSSRNSTPQSDECEIVQAYSTSDED